MVCVALKRNFGKRNQPPAGLAAGGWLGGPAWANAEPEVGTVYWETVMLVSLLSPSSFF